MIDMSNWKGNWISDSDNINTLPAPYFRKEFYTPKKIQSARAYIAVGGLYELYINGKKIGHHRLDPMYTRFDRRNLYVSYDVTAQLRDGKNAIGILLGNGWYNHQSLAVWNFDRAPWRNRPAFCLDLRITYDDGTTQVIKTDNSWKTHTGPLVFNSIYTGEHYDSRLEMPGWNTMKFDDKDWQGVMLRATPSKHIVSQTVYPIRNVEEIPAKSIRKFNDSTYVVDFGRNFAGVTKVRLDGGRTGKTTVIGGRRRVGGRTNSGNRQYQQPLPLPDGGASVCQRLEQPRASAPLRRGRGSHRVEAKKAGPTSSYRGDSGWLTGSFSKLHGADRIDSVIC